MSDMGLSQAEQAWQDALWALLALQVDPLRLGGVWLRAGHGPVRQQWLQWLNDSGLKTLRVPAQVDDERLLGGIDLAASLHSGHVVQQSGLLAQADGGAIVLTMAERLPARLVAHITQAQDSGWVHATCSHAGSASRFGVIAIDEAEPDETTAAPALTQRLALWLNLHPVAISQSQNSFTPLSHLELAQARTRLPQVQSSVQQVQALCQTAQALGIDSVRAPLLALRLACVSAALDDRSMLVDADLQLAARLVLGPRANQLPEPAAAEQTAAAEPPESEEPPAPPAEQSPAEQSQPEQEPAQEQEPAAKPDQATEPEPALEEMLLAAAAASLPPHLLDRLLLQKSHSASRAVGHSGENKTSRLRGRPLAARPGQPGNGARLHIAATLISAAPKQKLRQNAGQNGALIRIRSEDFHIHRYAQKTPSCLIFAIDASGSAAQARLAEAKGAVELLLEQSYARRDSVCVIAFRLAQAQLLLPATRSLVRAKRALGDLPGGGGTPLACGIASALLQAQLLARSGSTPFLVLLSDGRANVSLTGVGGRAQAREDAQTLARQWRQTAYPALWIDTSPQPEPQAQQLANLMGAHYFPMPYVQAQRMASVVQDLSAQLRRP